MPDDPNDTLGLIGEQAFALWAAQAGYTPTRIGHDRHGWDYIIQANPQQASKRRLRLDAPVLTCLVQVKATRKSEGSVAMNLSNLQRLATSPMPAFVLMVVVGDHDEPVDARVVHLDREWVERISRRILQVPLEERGRLNKLTVGIPWAERGAALEQPFGRSLLAFINAAVAHDAHEYAHLKAEWARAAGFEGHRINLKLGDVMDGETYLALAEFSVGLRDSLSVPMAISEVRFGVSEELAHSAAAESISIAFADAPPGRRVNLTIRRADFSEQVSFDAKLRIASDVLSFLPHEHDLWCFDAPHLKLVMRAPGAGADPRIDASLSVPGAEENAPLRAVARATKALRLMTEGKPLELAVRPLDRETVEEHVMPIQHTSGGQLDPSYLRAIEDAQLVADVFGLPELTLDNPMALERQAHRLRALSGLIAAPAGEDEMTLTAPLLEPSESGDGQVETTPAEVVLVTNVHAVLGDRLLVQFFALRAHPQVTQDSGRHILRLQSRFPLLLARRVLPKEMANMDVLFRLATEESERLDAAGLAHVLRPGRDAGSSTHAPDELE